jgi:hypothetical protein
VFNIRVEEILASELEAIYNKLWEIPSVATSKTAAKKIISQLIYISESQKLK